MTDAPDIWASFDHTVLVRWDTMGLPELLTGTFAAPLPPGTFHTVTGWNPQGVDAKPAANAEAHRQMVQRMQREGLEWKPVVGASPDGSHHELGIITGDLSRAEAVALGAAFDQLAVFELDDERISVVPCDHQRPVTDAVRGHLGEGVAFSYADVIAWRDEHEEITGTTLPRTQCPQCGAADPRPIMYGMPMGMPPDWIALGGCVIDPDNPHLQCRTREHTW